MALLDYVLLVTGMAGTGISWGNNQPRLCKRLRHRMDGKMDQKRKDVPTIWFNNQLMLACNWLDLTALG